MASKLIYELEQLQNWLIFKHGNKEHIFLLLVYASFARPYFGVTKRGIVQAGGFIWP